MRVRALDADGDAHFGRSGADFLLNSPEAVAQVVRTRLQLMTGEWFLDQSEGTDYRGQILGAHTGPTYDLEIRERILGTQGVQSIETYSSEVVGRDLAVAATLNTIYGQATVSEVL